MTTLTNEQFARVRRLSLSLTGIELAERHRQLLANRCRRLKMRDAASLEALLNASEGGDEAARDRLVGLLTTSYTGFFRTPPHFSIAAEHAFKAIGRRGSARLWSAAAATGEEAYSLAMAIIEVSGRDDQAVEILATDINPQVLEAGRRGEYGEAALATLTAERRARFFGEAAGAGRWSISPAARRQVKFLQLNLSSEFWPVEGRFDVIFCRNVLMYLEMRRRFAVLQRMASLLASDGLLILDPAEHLGEAQDLFAGGKNGVFARRSAPQGVPGTSSSRRFSKETRFS